MVEFSYKNEGCRMVVLRCVGPSNFLRMLNVSIPYKSFDVIKSYALLLIDQKRNLVESGLNL